MTDVNSIVSHTVRDFKVYLQRPLSHDEGDLLYAIVNAQYTNHVGHARFSVTSNSTLEGNDVLDLIVKNDVLIRDVLLATPSSPVDYFDELFAEESGLNTLLNKVYRKLNELGFHDEHIQYPLCSSRLELGKIILKKIRPISADIMHLNLISENIVTASRSWINPITGSIKGSFLSTHKWVSGRDIFINLINLADQNHKLDFTLTLWGADSLNKEPEPLVTAIIANGTVKETKLNTVYEDVVLASELEWDEAPLPKMGVSRDYLNKITSELKNRLMLVDVSEVAYEFHSVILDSDEG